MFLKSYAQTNECVTVSAVHVIVIIIIKAYLCDWKQ